MLAVLKPVDVHAQPPAGANVVALVYDDSTISDVERAALVDFVADSVPTEKWETVSVKRPVAITSLIDDFYDFFPSGERAAPATVQALERAIRRHNENLPSKTLPPITLRLPPFPVHAFFTGRPTRATRLFEAATRKYSFTNNPTDARYPTDRHFGVLSKQPRSVTDARQFNKPDDVRHTTLTTILVTADRPRIDQFLIGLGDPREILLFSPTITEGDDVPRVRTGFSTVELLEGTQECTDGREWMANSPYLSAWRASAAAATLTASRDALHDLAAHRMPLYVLDVGFDGGHGSEVVGVATQLLEDLGAGFLADCIKHWELVPSTSTSAVALQMEVDAFRNERPTSPVVLSGFVEELSRWLKASPALEVGHKFNVPDLMFSALMWRTFNEHRWVNMSSRVRSPMLNEAVDPLFRESKGALFAAVGNTHVELNTGYVPQDHAQRFDQVMTVTYASKDGMVGGEYSQAGDSIHAPRVLLVGPGCGFVGISGTGSSFATPYVAVATWLRQLLDLLPAADAPTNDVQDDNAATPAREAAARQHELLAANIPLPSLSSPVESHGLFDPAYLLLRPGPHLVMADRTLRPLTDYNLRYHCVGRQGEIAPQPPSTSTSTTETLRVYEDTATRRTHLWLRRIVSNFSTIEDCAVDSLTLTAINGSDRTTYELNRVKNEVSWVTWTSRRGVTPWPTH